MTGTDTHGPGMSYCFGCKQDVTSFNTTVVNCQAETRQQIVTRETNSQLPENDPNKQVAYRGNVNAQCEINTTATGRWAGLYSREWAIWANGGQYNGYASFHPNNWSGIDCSGLVQRAVDSGRNVVPEVTITIPASGSWISSQNFHTQSRVFETPVNNESKKKLRKGDLIKYRGHISMVYSDRPDEKVKYQIIHAYGNHVYDHDNDRSTDRIFSRKVIITRHDIKRPTGYGRIRLWD